MSNAYTTVLLVENNHEDARKIQGAFADSEDKQFSVVWVSRLVDALDLLERRMIDVILLAMTLPDGRGFEDYDQIQVAAPSALILILSEASNEEIARLAVRRGAHDYLAKEHIDSHWLPRAIRYDIERKIVQDALLNSEARFRAMSDASPLGIFVSDSHGACVYTNEAYQKISGLTFDQSLGTNLSSAIHPDDRQRVLLELKAATHSHEPFQTELRFLRDDGSIVWTRVNSAPMNQGTEPHGRVKTIEDISERKEAEVILRESEEALFEEKERAQVTLNSIGDAVLATDINGHVTYLNLVAEKMTGWSNESAIGQPLVKVFNIVHGNTQLVTSNPVRIAIEENRAVELTPDCVLIRRDGVQVAIEDSTAPIHNRGGDVLGAVIVFHDVSESRAIAQKMAHLAQHDFLTDLPNRMLLTERLSQAIGLARRHRKQAALMFLDLDYFKHINDTLGHTIGDQLLQSVAKRLVTCVRATDTVCRQGGDEFVILLAEIEHPQEVTNVANKLRDKFVSPHVIDGHEIQVTFSIGISIYPDDGLNVDDIMEKADTAMYHAKANGRNNAQFFKAGMDNNGDRRLFVNSEYIPTPNNA